MEITFNGNKTKPRDMSRMLKENKVKHTPFEKIPDSSSYRFFANIDENSAFITYLILQDKA